ncbi:MAG: hypothetical protein ACFCUR_03045 [Rhodomicrobiaceae bacterium]
MERLRDGREKRIDKPDQVFNRIHRDDIAATVLAGIRAGHAATGVFNVTDDEPAPPQEVVTYAAELLRIEPPPMKSEYSGRFVQWRSAASVSF